MSNKIRTQVVLRPETMDLLRRLCEEEQRTMSAVIERALALYASKGKQK